MPSVQPGPASLRAGCPKPAVPSGEGGNTPCLGGRGPYLRMTGVRRVDADLVGSRARVSAVQRIRCVDAICTPPPAAPLIILDGFSTRTTGVELQRPSVSPLVTRSAAFRLPVSQSPSGAAVARCLGRWTVTGGVSCGAPFTPTILGHLGASGSAPGMRTDVTG
jgi:hypothetical protein